MKRLLFMLIVLLACQLTWAHDFAVENSDGVTIYYNKLSSTEVEVTYKGYKPGYSVVPDRYEYGGKVVIPSSVTYSDIIFSVTSIGESAFSQCKSLISVTIPNSVISIGERAFRDCSGLTGDLIIPNSVTYIDSAAFYDCSGLTTVSMGNSVSFINSWAFSGCSNLKYINLPTSLEIIYDTAFCDCNSLSSVWISSDFEIRKTSNEYRFSDLSPTEGFLGHCLYSYYFSPLEAPLKVFWLPNTTPQLLGRVTYVSTSNVSTDENLTRMDFLSSYFEDEQGVKYIPVSPSDRTAMAIDFDYSSTPTSLTLPQTLTYKGIDLNLISVGEYCLSRIGSVEHINIETQLPEIPNGFAYKCSSLQDFTVDRYPTRIGASAFEDCTSLADFVMLDWSTNVETGVDAFNNAGLKNLRIGRQLVYPDEEAASPFANNKSLETLWITDIPTEIGPYMFKGCDKLNEVNVGDRILNIRHYAFSGCKSISRFAFGAAVKTIEEEAFSDCTGMKNLYAEPIAPPICGSQALDDINRWECTLHVQPQSKDSYAAAPQWKEFLFWETGFGITIDISSMILNEGETRNLRVMSNSAEGAVTWMSTNPSIVTVDESGTVNAVGEGNASIVAINSDGLMANCMVTVIGDSGIEDVLTNSKTYVVRTENGNIIIEGTEPNELVEIFNLSGVLSYKGSTFNIPSLNRGIYILRIGDQTFKLRL